MKPHVIRALTKRRERWRLKDGEPRAHNPRGLAAITVLTQKEVAELLGISRQRVQQLERLGLWKVRARKREFV